MRKQGKRRKYTKDPCALARTLFAVSPLESSKKTDLGLAYRLAFDALIKGKGTDEDANTLAVTLNITLVLCEMGFGGELEGVVIEAQTGLAKCIKRGETKNKWLLDGPGITAIREALALHDEQLNHAAQIEISAAMAEVHRRLKAGKVFKVECVAKA